MSEWKPKMKAGLKWESLELSAEEGFLLSRLDGTTSVDALTHLTGFSAEQVQQALHKLTRHGAIEPAPSSSGAPSSSSRSPKTPPTSAKSTNSPNSPKSTKHTMEGPPLMSADDSEVSDDDPGLRAALDEMTSEVLDLPSLEGDDTDEGAAVVDEADALVRAALAERHADGHAGHGHDGSRADAVVDDAPAVAVDKDAGKGTEDIVDEDATDDGEEEDAEAAAVAEGNHRKLFETTLHGLPQEEREKKARTEGGPTLLALCFDPVPQVIHGILENPEMGFPHARLIARHHRTPQGIEALFTRNELVRDGQVQRYLMANPMLQDAHLKKLLAPKRVAVVYKWALSRDLPEKNRNKVRTILRSKWSTAEGDERANLIWSTEGRVLVMLIGIPLDSQATQLLCARTIHSALLIQNLARFASTPPALLTHLLKQAAVKRQVHLRNMIFQHPNCPSSEKRKYQ